MISKDPDQENKCTCWSVQIMVGKSVATMGYPEREDTLSRYLERLPGYRHVEEAGYGGVCTLKISSRIHELQVMPARGLITPNLRYPCTPTII